VIQLDLKFDWEFFACCLIIGLFIGGGILYFGARLDFAASIYTKTYNWETLPSKIKNRFTTPYGIYVWICLLIGGLVGFVIGIGFPEKGSMKRR
jgi:hypothetical protein